MEKDPRSNAYLVALLGREPEYKKREAPHDFRSDHSDQLVYEDEDVFAIEQRGKETGDGSKADCWDTRILLAPKRHVRSLLDLDAGTGVALLRGIQRVALTLGLEKRGFEISVDVLPPRQHADLLKIKIRSGERKTSSADTDETDT